MLRQKWGSVVCPSCRNLVGVNDEQCLTCGRRNPGLWGYGPFLNRLGQDLGFTHIVIGGCGLLYALMLVSDVNGINMSLSFNFLSPAFESLFLFGNSGVVPVLVYGRWWTFITAGWLHAGLLHIAFNMMGVRQLAPATSEMYGASRMVIIYTVSGIAGFATSTLAGLIVPPYIPILGPARFTVGASAPLCGLLGALLYYGRRTGSSLVSNQAKSWVLSLIFFGFVMQGIDNWAHAGGLAGGYVVSKFLDPLQPERLDHLLIALGCLALTAIAIVYSFVHGLPFVG
jgi:rhomboid protease GluP